MAHLDEDTGPLKGINPWSSEAPVMALQSARTHPLPVIDEKQELFDATRHLPPGDLRRARYKRKKNEANHAVRADRRRARNHLVARNTCKIGGRGWDPRSAPTGPRMRCT